MFLCSWAFKKRRRKRIEIEGAQKVANISLVREGIFWTAPLSMSHERTGMLIHANKVGVRLEKSAYDRKSATLQLGITVDIF